MTMALTKDDIKALKQADDVHAIRYRTDGDTPGHSLLRACKDSHKDGRSTPASGCIGTYPAMSY